MVKMEEEADLKREDEAVFILLALSRKSTGGFIRQCLL